MSFWVIYNDSKLGFPKFVSFSSLIGKFSHFMWLITALLMKLDVVVDEKKKSQKWGTHSIEATKIQVGSDGKPGSPKFISFSLLIGKFSQFKWLTTALLMKIDVIIDEKKNSQKSSTYWERTPVTAMATVSPGHLNSSAFHCS